MLVYKASQILDMAAQVADLKNSAIISHDEKVRILNECFYELYQKCISCGDKTWLKTMTIGAAHGGIEGFAVPLPDDFLQLESVTLKNTGQAVLRRAGTEPPQAPRYEIVNNTIVFYGSIADSVLIKYFPVPMTLQAPEMADGDEVVAPDFTREGTVALGGGVYGGAVYEAHEEGRTGTITLTLNNKDGYISTSAGYGQVVFPAPYYKGDNISITLYTSARTAAVVYTVNGQRGVILYDIPLMKSYTVTDANFRCFFDDGAGRIIAAAQDDSPIFYYADGVITAQKLISKWTAAIADWSAVNERTCAVVSDSLVSYLSASGTFDGGVAVMVKRGADYVAAMDIGASAPPPIRVYDVSGQAAYGTDECFTVLTETTYNFAPYLDDDVSAFYGVMGGGEYCVADAFGGAPILRVYQADTVLAYPNALFYPCLEYMMAVRYKMKQGDNQGMVDIGILVQERLDAFYESLPRDAFSQTRINNFYGGAYL